MIIPFYYLNKEEKSKIVDMIELYAFFSNDRNRDINDNDRVVITKKLASGNYLTTDELFKTISACTLVLLSNPIVTNMLDSHSEDYKISLCKLFSLHQHILTDDDYVENMRLLEHTYKLLKEDYYKIKDSLNDKEIKSYAYLELLQL